MSAAGITALLTLLGGIVGLVGWWMRRRHSPTPTERIDDLDHELDRLNAEMVAARRRGDHATADALRRRLRIVSQSIFSVGVPGAGGQRRNSNPASRDIDTAASIRIAPNPRRPGERDGFDDSTERNPRR